MERALVVDGKGDIAVFPCQKMTARREKAGLTEAAMGGVRINKLLT
jgi:hypothetical protein